MISSLERRVCEISYHRKLGHLSSCLTAVGILDQIYRDKRPEDIVVLSQGQAGLGLYVALERHEGHDAEMLYEQHGTHPNRDPEHGIHVSAGSLGCAATIALGLAMANRHRNVYVVASDGECWEPEIVSTLMLKAKFGVKNLRLHVNHNGYTCIEKVNPMWCLQPIMAIDPTARIRDTSDVYQRFPFLQGVQAHYYNMTAADWAWVEANS